MKSKSRIQGVLYKPRYIKQVVELSASPLLSSSKAVLGCIETARYVTQRETALDRTIHLLKGLSENQLLESIVDVIHDDLGYDRVRLYSLTPSGDQLTGITYSGKHHKITKDEFLGYPYKLPPKLKDILTTKNKAGLIRLDKSHAIEESFGYWEVGIRHEELRESANAENRLELDSVTEVVGAPLVVDGRRWALFIDWKEHVDNRFSSDDLQGLTILSKLSSVALKVVHINELRFRFAFLGETALGPDHEFIRLIKPKSFRAEVYRPLRETLSTAHKYLQTSATPKAK